MIGQITIQCPDPHLSYGRPLPTRRGIFLRLLERELNSPEEALSTGCLAGGRAEPGCNVAAQCKLDGVCYIGCHEVIGVAIAEFRFETGEELFFATIPGDENFYPRHLSAV